MRQRGCLGVVLGSLFVVAISTGVGWFVGQRLPEPIDMSVFAGAFADIVGPLFAAFSTLR